MSKCFIEGMGGGGGTGKLFAVIQATYPEGSTCTATNGAKTLTAKDTSGLALFAIPEPETLPEIWTVTATDGTNTKSQSVSITTEGQMESVTLSYEFVIFDKATQSLADVKAKFNLEVGEEAMTLTESGDYFKFSGGNVSNFSAMYTDAIDLTNYTTLEVYGYSSHNNTLCYFGFATSIANGQADSFTAKKQFSTTAGVLTLDVSELSGAQYFGVHHGNYGDYPSNFVKYAKLK